MIRDEQLRRRPQRPSAPHRRDQRDARLYRSAELIHKRSAVTVNLGLVVLLYVGFRARPPLSPSHLKSDISSFSIEICIHL